LGLPGMGNFVGEFLILLGAFKANVWATAIATGGLILASVYALWMLQKAYYGPAKSDAPLEELSGRELVMMLTMVVILLAIGLYPQPLLNTSAGTVSTIQSMLTAIASAAP
ncbi:MAG TPA: NADH-quinone oxidoreductase subunit M, partial [Pseudomonadales bacterium]|nr:NADH-quinone oxidoreductase subunit M [Pseudomonadales bacterium]